jgi:hypothetical protein
MFGPQSQADESPHDEIDDRHRKVDLLFFHRLIELVRAPSKAG